MAGDGTTSVVVICGALLSKCIDLLARGVHPTIISDAFGLAARKAVEVLPLCPNLAPASILPRAAPCLFCPTLHGPGAFAERL